MQIPQPFQALFVDVVGSKILHYLNYEFVFQSVRFSVMSLLLLVLVIVSAAALSRYARRILRQKILPKLSLDAGIQYALLKITHYTIIVLGALYASRLASGWT